MQGWSYNYIELTESELNSDLQLYEWEPVILNKTEFIIINKLIKDEYINISDIDFQNFINKEKIALDSVLERLHRERLIFYTKSEIKLSTRQCLVVCKNGIFYAGEDSNGLMSKWIEKFASS